MGFTFTAKTNHFYFAAAMEKEVLRSAWAEVPREMLYSGLSYQGLDLSGANLWTDQHVKKDSTLE